MGIANEFDANIDHASVVTPEIVSLQEEGDAASSLVPDERNLTLMRRAREQEISACGAWRSNEHPTLVLLGKVPVFDQSEVQLAGEEGDRLVVVAHHERDVRNRLFQLTRS